MAIRRRAATATPSPLGPAARWPILVAAGAALVVNLDTMVNIALPAIAEGFDVDVAALTWLVVCYVLTYACLLVTTGRLADAFGHQRVLRAGLALTVVGVAGAGLAPGWPLFLASRVVQGGGAALVLGAAPAMVTTAVGPSQRAAALGRFQLGVAAGFAVGPPLGGMLVDAASWRWVFLARAPLAAALLVVLHLRPVAPSPAAPGAKAGPTGFVAGVRRLDLAGTLTLGGAVAGGLFALNRGGQAGWSGPAVLGGLAVLAVLGPGWVLIERRSAAPALDPTLFHSAGFSVANMLNAMANATMFSIWLLAPFYLITVLGHGPVLGGVLLAANPFASALAAPLAGRWSARLGAGRLAAVGLAVQTGGLLAVSRLGAATPGVVAAGALATVGFGIGLFTVPNQSLVMGAIPRRSQGVAGGLTQMARTVGVVGGVALGSLGLSAARRHEAGRLGVAATDPATFLPGFRLVFLGAALVAGVATVLSLARLHDRDVMQPGR